MRALRRVRVKDGRNLVGRNPAFDWEWPAWNIFQRTSQCMVG